MRKKYRVPAFNVLCIQPVWRSFFPMAACLFFACNQPPKQQPTPEWVRSIQSSPEYKPGEVNSRVFYVDLSRPSGDFRFFVVNMEDATISGMGLCCNGKIDTNGQVIFSNVPGSGCSSRGVYRIGASYVGSWGRAYRLHGLSATNSNAYARNIVLHAYKGIPRLPTGKPICRSEGCPTVNPEFLNELSSIVDGSPKPTLLLIN